LKKDFSVKLIRAPIPIKALKHINTYLIESDGERFIVDTGTPTEETIKSLRGGLQELGLDFKDIDGIIVTHMHIDHIGNAGLIEKEAGTVVYMGSKEFEFVRFFVLSQEESLRVISDLFEESGVPRDLVKVMLKKHPALSRRKHYEFIENIHLLNDGDIIKVGSKKLKAIETPGHSPHHMCFLIEDEKLLFSGDHILFDITPNISFPISENGDPLGDYITSLNKVKDLDVDIVKPGHREQLTSLKKRVMELKHHHLNRLLEVAKILSVEPLTAYETASKMTWDVKFTWEEFPPHQVFFAVSEAIAHIKFLEVRGYLEKHLSNGLVKYELKEDIKSLEEDLRKELGIQS